MFHMIGHIKHILKVKGLNWALDIGHGIAIRGDPLQKKVLYIWMARGGVCNCVEMLARMFWPRHHVGVQTQKGRKNLM